jgi:hypothetical protein
VNGTWEFDTSPHPGGGCATERTTSAEAYLYRDIDLSAYSTQIDDEQGIAWYGYWVQNYDDENSRLVVRFYNASGVEFVADRYDSSWIHYTTHQNAYLRYQKSIPVRTRSVRIELHAKRFEGNHTNVIFDDVSFKVRFVESLGAWLQFFGPFYNNGGFESGSMAGWTQVAGNWDVDDGSPHSGTYATDDTGGSPVYFHRTSDLRSHTGHIDAGNGWARYGYWARNRDYEWVRLVVVFLDTNQGELWRYDSDWLHYTPLQYAYLGYHNAIPVGSRYARLEVHAKRTEGSLTDVNFDDVTFEVRFPQQPDIRVEPNSLSFNLSSLYATTESQAITESSTTSTPTIIQSDNTSLILDFTVPTAEIQEMQINGERYQRLFLPGEGLTQEVGRSQLPTLGRWIAVPAGTNATVQVLESSFTIMPEYKIYPAQELHADHGLSKPDFSFSMDPDFYQRDIFYPQSLVILEPAVNWRGIQAALLRVYPFQYNPKTGELKVYSHIRIKINLVNNGIWDTAVLRHRSHYFEEVYRDLLLNYDAVSIPASISNDVQQATSGCDFLIITAPEFEISANALAAWRNQQGLSTQVRTTNETGTTAAAIQSYIQDAYDTWSPAPSFVLLLGDAEFIPPHYQTNHSYHGTLLGTDLYYATVDGTDYFPDISIGRIAVDTITEAEKVINDIIDYERFPVDDENFYSRAAMAAYFQDGNRDGYEDRRFILTSEEIRDYLRAQSYDVQRIYTTPSSVNPTHYNNSGYANGAPLPAELLRVNGFAWDGSGGDISNVVNTGVSILNHRDHGAFWGWGDPRFTVNDVSNLTNGDKLPVVFSINCQTGWFDNETDDHSDGTSYSDISFAEAWHRNPNGGAVGVIAATRVSYSGHNDTLVKGFYDAIWPNFLSYTPSPGRFSDPQRRMGDVLNYGKLYYATQYSDSDTRKIEFEEFHYFGDPTTQIWTALPNLTQKTFTIHNEGDADLIVTETIKQNGSCWLDVIANFPLTIAPGGLEDVVVTVDRDCTLAGTHSDRLLIYSNDPDESLYPDGVDVSLTVPSVSQIAYTDSSVVGDNGNADGVVNPGEIVSMSVALRNWGNDVVTNVNAIFTTTNSYINILDDTIFYSMIDHEGIEGDDGDGIRFEVLPDMPGNTVIFFSVQITTANARTWVDEFAVVIAPDTTPPYVPSSPSPLDGVYGEPTTLSLTWNGGDPDGDLVSYDVYMSTEHPLADLTIQNLTCTNVITPSCPVELLPGTKYFWYVIATDEYSATISGPVWNFVTVEYQQVFLPVLVRNY